MSDVTERSLVTFALLLNNQECSIREAVEGALSQMFEPLKKILSDNCSTDVTFEIMQETVSAYNGCNKIILRTVQQPVQLLSSQCNHVTINPAQSLKTRFLQAILSHAKATYLPIRYFDLVATTIGKHKQ